MDKVFLDTAQNIYELIPAFSAESDGKNVILLLLEGNKTGIIKEIVDNNASFKCGLQGNGSWDFNCLFTDGKDDLQLMYDDFIADAGEIANNYEIDTSSIEIVKAVQEALNNEGYDCGTADGIAGSKTKEAIDTYKRDNNLNSNSDIDKELLDSLNISLDNKGTLPKQNVPYDVAYKVSFSGYGIYYLVDNDARTITIFTSDEPQAQSVCQYSGDFEDGIYFSWDGLDMEASYSWWDGEDVLIVKDAVGNKNEAKRISLSIVSNFIQ